MSGEEKRSDGLLGERGNERRRAYLAPPALYATALLLDSTNLPDEISVGAGRVRWMNRMLATAVEIDVPAGPDAEGARRATGEAGPAGTSRTPAPDPEVPAKAQRRRFSAEYRLRILKQADACKGSGAIGALLRREGLYSSHLVTWRRRRDAGALVGMRASKRGPRAKPVDPRTKQLEKENARLQRQLKQAVTIIEIQKKVAGMLGIPL